MLAFAPRSLETPTEGRAFQRWYSKQVRLSVPASWQTKPVTLVELIDYQCPVCRRAATEYREVIHRTESTYGDSFGFLRVDFPLDNECNSVTGSVSPGGPHPAACEAAAAVRLAKTAGADREREVIEWLWAHQARLTPAKVFDGISERFGLDVRQNYNTLLQAISQDAAEGRRLHVSGTPTFFLNGRRLPLLRAATLEVAIGIELKLLSRNAQRGKQ
jgi:hypothetical protein